MVISRNMNIVHLHSNIGSSSNSFVREATSNAGTELISINFNWNVMFVVSTLWYLTQKKFWKLTSNVKKFGIFPDAKSLNKNAGQVKFLIT